MYLKKLEIQGFKSFADKVSLDFNSGITSVVGPNGSGKSNISDSIRWVLGEQSAKTLRGGKMEDVIFAGTQHRKPLGFAEVSLTIDNSAGRLPVEFSEVTVTRRVYRSGESEFLINKTPCRLKDIHQLFMDTGIGKDGYSIIGQGRVDEILSSRSEDRRAIFEEASGIMKYKTRKIEAEKKLESVEQNLIRIHDIILELEVQLDPLEKQSETAKKYLSYRDQLKEVEVNVFVENIERLQEKLKELIEKHDILTTQIEAENRKLERNESESQGGVALAKSLEEKQNTLKQELFDIENGIEKCNGEIALELEKIAHLKENINKGLLEIEEASKKLLEIESEKKNKEERNVYLVEKQKEYSEKLKENQLKMEEILSQLDEGERHIENLKSSILDKMDMISDKKTQMAGIKSHVENVKVRENNIVAEIYQINLDRDKEQFKKEQLEESIKKYNDEISFLSGKYNELSTELKDAQVKIEEQKKSLNEIKGNIQFKNSRHKMLQSMERNFEGYYKSVRMLLQECQKNQDLGRGIHGALAQIISVDKKYATAIEIVLGSALQNVVVDTEDDGKKAINFLKSNKLGRATFLPISAVKGKYLEGNYVRDLESIPEYCGVASDLVECSPQFKDIILNLLGRVVVVKDLEAGVKIAKKHRYSFRIVTLEGDILSTTGSMSGGSTENRDSGLLNRSNEIQKIEEEIKKLEESDKITQENIKELSDMIDEISVEIKDTQNMHKENELSKIRDESHLEQINDSLLKAESRVSMLVDEKDQLKRKEDEIGNDIAKYQSEIELIEKEIKETQEIITNHQEKHKGEQEEKEELSESITDLKIALGSANESLQAVKESLERINSENREYNNQIGKKKFEVEQNKTKIAEFEESIKLHEKEISQLEHNKTIKVAELEDTSIKRREIEEKVEVYLKETQEINKNLRLLAEELTRLDVNKAKWESEIDSIRGRLWDEYELTYSTALEMKKDVGSLVGAQKLIQDLKNNIRSLGAVNVAAIEEYTKTKERFEFMDGQRDDLLSTKEKLNKVIDEMITIMKKQFLDQFKLINENFNIVFRELFDGGRAELTLVDPSNVLESGIEIEVQPPGKKLQNMSLLSGGERAFTAIALLFSILKLRPTPFCLLDEIEAALDEANVNRFASYISKHTALTQFLVITHRKGTMEASDSLYGVTMQEHGISKVVSMRLGEKAG